MLNLIIIKYRCTNLSQAVMKANAFRQAHKKVFPVIISTCEFLIAPVGNCQPLSASVTCTFCCPKLTFESMVKLKSKYTKIIKTV